MMWADPFSPDNLEQYRGHHDDLRQVRLLAEQAQERIDHALALKGVPYSLSSLDLGAEMLDYAGMRYIDALEMAEAWQHMGARPSRRQVDSELHEFCNGCLVQHAAGDLMDAVTELREDYRAAWLGASAN